MFGFYRIAAAVPEMRVADVEYNSDAIVSLVKEADEKNVALTVFPELSITGYTCADLFHQSVLIDGARASIRAIAEATKDTAVVFVVGAPVYYRNKLYNCGIVIQSGRILGVVPKVFNPNYREFYEKRWFASAAGLANGSVKINKQMALFGKSLVFEYDRYFSFSVELCEDLWTVIPPSSYHTIAGVTVCVNLSASNELVSKSEYRRSLISQQSARCIGAYAYASSGVNESTTDMVFGGHALIAENGSIHAENECFEEGSSLVYSDIDCERLVYTRVSESSFLDLDLPTGWVYDRVKINTINIIDSLKRDVDKHPFVPSNLDERKKRCVEIFHIQSAGLAKRFKHTGSKKAVIGISGGLDSTLALLVIAETFRKLGKDLKDIIAVTMPGFGTTDRTYNNACEMCRLINADLREISIKDACLQHFKDIGHNPDDHSTTYENVQARERTQLLMDIANKELGLVIGTGDLSEIALGWSTYNGDHMSMYAVNCSVPKTLVRYLIQWVADNSDDELKHTLEDIINTPISPELVSNKKDAKINQVTEDIIGPYELHDFFLYHIVKYGAAPDKVAFLTEKAFDGKYDTATITKWLALFLRRFFEQQFKRSCIPDGPKVGTISLSPRGDWRMPSDAVVQAWLDKLEHES